MASHVHVVVVPSDEDGLRRTFHRRYTDFVDARHRWIVHLWQERFSPDAPDAVPGVA